MANEDEEFVQEEAALLESQRSADAADVIRETRDTLASLLETLPLLTYQLGPEGARSKVRAIVSLLLSGRSIEEEIEELRERELPELDLGQCVVCLTRYNTPGTWYYHNAGALATCTATYCFGGA